MTDATVTHAAHAAVTALAAAADRDATLPVSLLDSPLLRSEWVLYLLLGASVVSIAVIFERWWFFRRRRFDADALSESFAERLARGEFEALAGALAGKRALEARVLESGLRAVRQGPGAVEQRLAAELGRQKQHHERRLDWLATVASNAPFVGLFGTVLGIIRAFRDLSSDMAQASAAVMAGIAEALIATAVGLLVAIPALVAFNVFKGKVRHAVAGAQLLTRLLLAELSARTPESRAFEGGALQGRALDGCAGRQNTADAGRGGGAPANAEVE